MIQSEANKMSSLSIMFRRLDIVALITVGLLVVMALLEPRFYSRLNLINLARNSSLLTLVALGQMLVMIVGGFDLSIGATMALASAIGALTMLGLSTMIDPTLVAVIGTATGLLVGVVVGSLNGAIMLRLKINPFMATLGMASVVGGLALYLTKGVPIYGLPEQFTRGLGKTMFLDVPLIAWIGVVVTVALWLVLDFTVFGRHIYAVGGNPKAARATGINSTGPTMFAYATAGFLGALAGLLITARIGSGQATLGATTAIEAIAAAVVGGVSLRGGQGRVWRVVSAAIFITIVSNIMSLVRVDSKWQTFVLGAAVIIAAVVDQRSQKGAKQ